MRINIVRVDKVKLDSILVHLVDKTVKTYGQGATIVQLFGKLLRIIE